MKIYNLASGQLYKKWNLHEFYTSARDVIMRYWSADALFWQWSFDYAIKSHSYCKQQGGKTKYDLPL